MATKGEQTREHILAIAEGLILQRGFSGTAIDDIIARAGLTKGAFFYHFEGKQDLAEKLMQRYLDQDDAFFQALFDRADELTEDPLQRVLLFLKLYGEAMADLPSAHPGCLVAAYTYESRQFSEQILAMTRAGLQRWRDLFHGRFDDIIRRQKPRLVTSATELADTLTAAIEGGILISRLADEKALVPLPILEFRKYLRLLFEP